MGPGQGEVTITVIEPCPIELDQPEAAPLMVAVAAVARAAARRAIAAMEMGSPRNIRGNRLVAGRAFPVLRLFAEGGVATVATPFQPGMSCAQWTGRDQAFHDGLAERRRRKHAGDQPEQAPHEPHQYMCTATT